MPGTFTDRVVVGSATTVLTVPVVVDLALSGPRRAFGYLAADSFYYLVVGRNWALHGHVSYGGPDPTNGFQPLWQFAVTGIARLVGWAGDSRTALMLGVLALSLACLTTALWLCAGALRTAYGHVPLLFAALPLGLFALLELPFWLASGAMTPGGVDPGEGPLPLYGTLWSYVNGMESAFAILAFSGVLLLCARRDLRAPMSGVALGALLAVLVLSRLDTVFVALGILVALLAVGLRRRSRATTRLLLEAVVVLAVVFASYIAWNLAYTGTALPVSGLLKSTFPHPSLANLRELGHLVANLANPRIPDRPEQVFRQSQIVIPFVFALAYLVVWVRREVVRPFSDGGPLGRYRLALAGSALGVVLLALYDLFFVPLYAQGSWYWPVSTLMVSLIGLDWAVGHGSRVLRSGRTWVPVVACCVVVAVASFLTLERRTAYHARFAEFAYDVAPRVDAFYHHRPPRMLSAEDGVDTYFLGTDALPVTGLAADPAAATALEQHRLLRLGIERGYDRIDSLTYQLAKPGWSEQRIALAVFFAFRGESVAPFRFSLEYYDPRTRFVIVRVRPASAAGR